MISAKKILKIILWLFLLTAVGLVLIYKEIAVGRYIVYISVAVGAVIIMLSGIAATFGKLDKDLD